jgi:hypothetical protein
MLKCYVIAIQIPHVQDKGYSERVMLVYDGLHYDALAVSINMLMVATH